MQAPEIKIAQEDDQEGSVAFNRDDELIGSVRAIEVEWETAAIHSLDTCTGYSVND